MGKVIYKQIPAWQDKEALSLYSQALDGPDRRDRRKRYLYNKISEAAEVAHTLNTHDMCSVRFAQLMLVREARPEEIMGAIKAMAGIIKRAKHGR